MGQGLQGLSPCGCEVYPDRSRTNHLISAPMRPLVYIIFSQKLDRFYYGVTQDSIEERLHKHNSHAYGPYHFTAKANDWKLFLTIPCESFSQARKIELHIKKMKSSRYAHNLKSYPQLVNQLLNRFK